MQGVTTSQITVTTGKNDIADAMGGGIRENSLVIIEGQSQTGKSVLCQTIAYNVLNTRGRAVAYFSMNHNRESFEKQMKSLSMDISDELAYNRFRVFELKSLLSHIGSCESLQSLVKQISELPRWFRFIVIDSPSDYFLPLKSVMQMDFLQSFKDMCVNYRSIIIVLKSESLEMKTLVRAQMLSDYYLKLNTENTVVSTGQVDYHVVKSLEVLKLNGVEQRGLRPVRFEIEPGLGIQVLPFYHVKI